LGVPAGNEFISLLLDDQCRFVDFATGV
jgi:hypothetical protein